MTAAPPTPAKTPPQNVIPREHGATAMLLTPFFAAAILLRRPYWTEFVALAAIAGAFALKDPLVVLARQRFVWKQEHIETAQAGWKAAFLAVLLVCCGIVLFLARDWRPFLPFVIGGAAFTALAVTVNVRNKQRSRLFQVASALALSATCLLACISAIDRIPEWAWLLWILCALQAAAGIFVVHARLEARIAARTEKAQGGSRQAAFLAQAILAVAALFFLLTARLWLAAALILTAACYLAELRRQKDPASLQVPLKRVGLQALAQSTVYTCIIIFGLWHY